MIAVAESFDYEAIVQYVEVCLLIACNVLFLVVRQYSFSDRQTDMSSESIAGFHQQNLCQCIICIPKVFHGVEQSQAGLTVLFFH